MLARGLVLLQRAVGGEHGIEMPDQQNLRSFVAVRCQQVPGTIERRAIDPFSRKPEVLEFPGKQFSNRLHARKIQCTAVDVDRFFQQRYRVVITLLDLLHDDLFGRDWYLYLGNRA